MKIVVLDGYALNPGDLNWAPIEQLCDEFVLYERTSKEDIVKRIDGADVVLTNKVPITKETLEQASNLKFIGVLATGYNIIDTEAAKEKGIVVSNIPSYSTYSVVQLVYAHLFAHLNRVELHSEGVYKGEWQNSKDFAYWKTEQIEASGKTFGIVGFGTIGKAVAMVAKAFQMKVMVFSRTKYPEYEDELLSFVDFETLLKESDVISLHCPLFENTKGMMNKEAFQKMKKTAYLINTARGPIVNQEDLAQALNQEEIAGAGIDVVDVEPILADNPLLQAKNCTITPHVGWATTEARRRLMVILQENLKAYKEGKPINVVNK